MSNEIQIKKSTKKIKVNDQGDFIILDLKNTNFMNSLILLLRELETASNSLLSRISGTENGSVEEITAAMAQAAEVCRQIAEKTDGLFGDGTCRKVFGEQAPGIFEFADFYSQIGELIKRYAADETAKTAQTIEKLKEKYSDRT